MWAVPQIELWILRVITMVRGDPVGLHVFRHPKRDLFKYCPWLKYAKMTICDERKDVLLL